MGECRFSVTCLYIYVMGELRDNHPNVMGWSSYWFILPMPATSAFSCWHKSCWQQPLVLEDLGKCADGRTGA